MNKQYTQLSRDERVAIAVLKEEGKTLSEIARKLGRNKSTISREIRRNSSPEHSRYTIPWVHIKASRRKRKASRRPRLKNEQIVAYCQFKLKEGWSPEQISGRIGIDNPGFSISHEAIYQYIYSFSRSDRKELVRCLRRSHSRRKKVGRGRAIRKTTIANRVSIDERPLSVERRKEFGHWETDTLYYGNKGGPLLNSLVERKTLLLMLTKVNNKFAKDTSEAIISRLERFPENARRTLTLDNGTENAGHEDITSAIGTKCYFTHPYASWERGINENVNGLVRWYLPKGTKLHKIPDEHITLVESFINNRPRKRLGYKTPIEAAASCVALER